MILTGVNRIPRRKTCPSAALSATNPTLIDPGANPGLRGEMPATNRLSHGTAHDTLSVTRLQYLTGVATTRLAHVNDAYRAR
jgi:hypothetical protein